VNKKQRLKVRNLELKASEKLDRIELIEKTLNKELLRIDQNLKSKIAYLTTQANLEKEKVTATARQAIKIISQRIS